MTHSELLLIEEKEGYDNVIIRNNKGEKIAHYILVDKNSPVPDQLPEGAEIIRVPIKKAVVDSEVYANAFSELSVPEIISGVLDGQYFTSEEIRQKLAAGEIRDLGPSSSPDLEGIISTVPEAVFISYYDGMQTSGLDKLGVPIIKMYDLQETTPLGRAEWIRLLGRLTGKGEEADKIFDQVKTNYEIIRDSETNGKKPKVLTEIMYEGVWSVPAGKSYQASLISDAGGDYFKRNDDSFVTLNLSPEQVLEAGNDADIWLIRFYGDEKKLKTVLDNDPVYKEFKPYKTGNIYFSDSSASRIFLEFPFHPDLLLKDYQTIFSGDTVSKLRYFKKIE